MFFIIVFCFFLRLCGKAADLPEGPNDHFYCFKFIVIVRNTVSSTSIWQKLNFAVLPLYATTVELRRSHQDMVEEWTLTFSSRT